MDAPLQTYAVAGSQPRPAAPSSGGFQRMLTLSLVVHAVALAVVVLAPDAWRTRQIDPKTVMTISLGGAPGPRAGGLTSMSGRPVQQAVPPTATPRPEPIRPPAAKPPEMTDPAKAPVKPPPKSTTRPETTNDQAKGRTPTTGAQVSEGQARADTGVVSDAIGLSTGGGGAGGQINLGNFCCPAYISEMLQIIQRNWQQRQGSRGSTIMRFVIDRQGAVSEISVARSSGNFLLDQAATRALILTRLPVLPREYPNPTLTVNLEFNFIQ